MGERAYDVVTFDCYGTLIDWEAGIAAAWRAAAEAGGTRLDRAAVLAAHARIEPQVQAEGFRSYREVLTETARRVAEELRGKLPPAGPGFLAESLPRWLPFPDTNPALERLVRAGYRLGILSNVDDDLLQQTCRHFTVRCEWQVTAQQVRSYKPGHAHFLTARTRLGDLRWLHAAQSFFHDVRPASELGIPVVWINRKGEPVPPDHPGPARQLRSLTELADWLAP